MINFDPDSRHDKMRFISVKKEMDYNLDLAAIEIVSLRKQLHALKEYHRDDDRYDDDDHFGHDPHCESCAIYGDCTSDTDCINPRGGY